MTKEFDPREFEKPAWINASFFEGAPRASQIRNTCIRVANIFQSLIHNAELSEDERSGFYARLESHNGQLVGLGIAKDMHSDKSRNEIFADPTTTAEWLAQSIYRVIGDTVPEMRDVSLIVQEFGEKRGENYVVRFTMESLDKIPDKFKKYIFMSLFITGVYNYLDPSPEEESII